MPVNCIQPSISLFSDSFQHKNVRRLSRARSHALSMLCWQRTVSYSKTHSCLQDSHIFLFLASAHAPVKWSNQLASWHSDKLTKMQMQKTKSVLPSAGSVLYEKRPSYSKLLSLLSSNNINQTHTHSYMCVYIMVCVFTFTTSHRSF